MYSEFPSGSDAPECVEYRADATIRGRASNPRVALYARYSTDGQKETSIDDQIRACRESARTRSHDIDPSLIFADAAITGASSGTARREQYHALRDAVRHGRVDVIYCDQQCRLARSAKESLTFFDELKDNNVRLITADGFDSAQPTAQLLFGMKSVFSEFFLEETRHRVQRGLQGEFERGAMITAIPYGYRLDVVRSEADGVCRWAVHAAEAQIIQEIFKHRNAGASCSQIAAILNGRGIPTPGSKTVKGGQYWRSSALWRILQNPIYSGVYVVNFGSERGVETTESTRLMPEFALVSHEVWQACQRIGKRGTSNPRGQSCYGGGKHAFAGVFRCGLCGASLSCHGATKTGAGSLHCAQCEHATKDGVSGRQPLYVSIKGVRLMLRWLLEKIISGEAMEAFKARLRAKLDGGHTVALGEARAALEKAMRARQRLGRLLHDIDSDDVVLEQQYRAAREEVLRLEAKVAELTAGLQRVNEDAINQQLNVDLSSVIDKFLSEGAPERTRAILQRVFPQIVLAGKMDRYTAIFEVQVSPGAIVAAATGTEEFVVDKPTILKLQLRTSGSKHPVWSVEQLSE